MGLMCLLLVAGISALMSLLRLMILTLLNVLRPNWLCPEFLLYTPMRNMTVFSIWHWFPAAYKWFENNNSHLFFVSFVSNLIEPIRYWFWQIRKPIAKSGLSMFLYAWVIILQYSGHNLYGWVFTIEYRYGQGRPTYGFTVISHCKIFFFYL